MTEPYYQDDWITIYHGDCLDILPITADVLITDPPYGISWSKGRNKRAGSLARNGIANDHDTSARDWALDRFLGPAAAFGSLYAPQPANLTHVLIWEKPPDAGVVGSTIGFRRDVEAIYLCGAWPKRTPGRGSVIRSVAPSVGNPSSPAGRTGRPHAKPVDLMRSLIDLAPGTVLDPFMGSGTTLRAAKDLGRKAIGIEIEERYCEIAAQRMAQEVLPI